VSCEQDPAPDNSSNDEYDGPSIEITSAEDIAKIGKTSAYPLNGVYTLTADIPVSDWTPIGTSTKPFKGTFNGGGKTITIDSTKGGLFAFTSDATITNLKIAGAITGTGFQVGSIAGKIEQTHIEDCQSSAAITLTASAYNASAGGIAGYILDKGSVRGSKITRCAASGNITLIDSENGAAGWMFYCGGLVGYAGNGSSDILAGVSNIVITKSKYTGGIVRCATGFPYTGGIIGCDYTGSEVSECYSAGTVRAEGGNLPYAGGIAGYVSANATVTNSYSSAAVNAVSASRYALAGGITGAVAKPATVSECYATGAVTATIKGDSTAGNGGTLGVPEAANAGGIAGASYYEAPEIKNCAALNSAVIAADTGTDGTLNPYRIAGRVDGTLTNNIAYSGMTLTTGETTRTLTEDDKSGSKQDGADTAEKPAQSVFQSTLGWDFTNTWQMGTDGYPIFKQ
jgi:hypothetical protein